MKWWPIGLLVAAAVASASNVAALTFEHLLDPRWGSEARHLQAVSLIAIAAFSAGGVWLIVRGASAGWAFAAVVLIVAVGFVPRIYDARLKLKCGRQQSPPSAPWRRKSWAEIETRRQDVETRIAAQRPYQGDEARLFMVFVTDADISRAGGPNHSPQSIALLQRALETKVLDPNTIVKQPVRADRGPEPLFINFYRNVRQVPEQSLLGRDWTILKLLAANGADLRSGRGAVRRRLARTRPLHAIRREATHAPRYFKISSVSGLSLKLLQALNRIGQFEIATICGISAVITM